MSKFVIDKPINSYSDDRLHRSSFARSIAKGFESWSANYSSLVVAIYGNWGSGKTSVANLVVRQLESDGWEERQIVRFDPWLFKDPEQIASHFFSEIARAIGLQDPESANRAATEWKKWAEFVRAGLKVADWTTKLPVAKEIPLPKDAMEKTAEFMERQAKALEETADGLSGSIQSFRDDLVASLAKLKSPILVLVDDVDRLSSTEIRMLFQLIKANSDFPNIGFLVMCQRDVVEHSLSELMAKGLDSKFPVGRYFLDKIVHVGLNIPELGDHALHDELQAAVKRAVPSGQFRWIGSNSPLNVTRPYFKTPRQISRFESALSFQVGLFGEGEQTKVCIQDLVLLETLRLHEPDVFAAIPLHRELLLQSHSTDISVVSGIARADTREQCTAILHTLFPLLAGFRDDKAIPVKAEELKRVCEKRAFDTYFWLQPPIQNQDVTSFC